MKIIPAEKVRLIMSLKSLEEKMSNLEESILIAAHEGRYFLSTETDHPKDYAFWNCNLKIHSEDWAKAKKCLESSGFRVDFIFEDNYKYTTLISWVEE